MPFFMDLHHLPGTSLAEIEHAHLRDVEAQDRHGVKYVRFFHDATSGDVFCVAEAPSAQACIAVHMEANGMPPDRLIEVEPLVMQGFLGDGMQTSAGVAVDARGEVDPGTRTIMFTDIVDSTRLTEELGDAAGVDLVDHHNTLTREQLVAHKGREVKHTGDGLMASFREASNALTCAVEIQRALATYRTGAGSLPLQLRIGLNAGEPVPAHGDLFGLAVNVSRRICDAAGAGEILVSTAVAQLAPPDTFDFEIIGPHDFKGVRDPVVVHRVHW